MFGWDAADALEPCSLNVSPFDLRRRQILTSPPPPFPARRGLGDGNPRDGENIRDRGVRRGDEWLALIGQYVLEL